MSEKIKLTDNLTTVIFKMSAGNPGAMRVLMDMLTTEHGLTRILDLDNMGIRGSQIWVCYKDRCGFNMDKFLELIKNRDPILKVLR